MVDDGTAVDCNLQAVVCIVVLGGFIIRVELQEKQTGGLNFKTVPEYTLIVARMANKYSDI